MKCQGCGHENRAQASFCAQCGDRLPRVCPHCDSPVSQEARFCDVCGALLEEPASYSVQASATAGGASGGLVSEPERRQLTVMFCDLVGSTALASRLDPEDMRRVIRAYQAACGVEISRYDGFVARYMGDGIMVYFGYPRAHEDDAERAVRAGLGVVDAVARLKPDLGPNKQVRLAVRVGISTGLVVVGDLIGEGIAEEKAVVGETPNLAARLQTFAQPNSVIVGRRTHELVGRRFEYEDLGEQELGGFPRPVRAWRVLRSRDLESRFDAAHEAALTPLMGRESDVDALMARWEQARTGDGQAVLVCGEAGIGKSRMVQELCDGIADQTHFYLRFQCSPYHTKSALYPVIRQLERALGFERDETPAQRLDKLEALLTKSAPRVREATPLLAALLSIPSQQRYPALDTSPQRQKERTLEALLDQMASLAVHRPLLMVFEDAHWMDPTSQELLDLVIERSQHLRTMLVVTFRHSFDTVHSGLPHVTTIALSRLQRRHCVAMVDRLVGGKTLPKDVVEQIVVKTDGVPLFVEELTKTVIESNLLEEAADRFVLHGPLPPLAIPTTIQDSLMARLDQLSPVKEIAQVGAVIGREFSFELLEAVVNIAADTLGEQLDRLVDAEILHERGRFPHKRYFFKHALVQDAAYESLLKTSRQLHHRKIAQALEEHFPETGTSEPELLAHHYSEAGLTRQAIVYWQRAGKKASEASANVEAIDHFKNALARLESLPQNSERARQELALQLAMAVPLAASRGYVDPDVERAYTRARALCEQFGKDEQLFPVLHGLFRFYVIRGEHDTSRRLGEKLLGLAQSSGDSDQLLEAHRALGLTLSFVGDFKQARTHLETGISLYDRRQHGAHASVYGHDPGVICLGAASWILWYLGYSDEALSRSRESLALGDELAHPYSQAFALGLSGVLHLFRGEWQIAQQRAEATLKLSMAHDFPFWLGWATAMKGSALAHMGHAAQGVAMMRKSIAALGAAGVAQGRPLWLGLLAEACLQAEQPEMGLEAVDDGLAMAEAQGDMYRAELHRLKGELLWASAGDKGQPQVEECFTRAVEAARQQDARSFELRALTSQVRLLRSGDDASRARRLLSELYAGFGGGSETLDLQAARSALAPSPKS